MYCNTDCYLVFNKWLQSINHTVGSIDKCQGGVYKEDNFSFTGLDHTLMHEDPVQRLPMVATPNSTLEWADQLKFALRTEFKMPSTVIESLDF